MVEGFMRFFVQVGATALWGAAVIAASALAYHAL